MSKQRQVTAIEQTSPVNILNHAGQQEQLGTYQVVKYEDENVLNHIFFPTGKTNPVNLGTSREGFQFIDHAAVIEPILDSGWEMEDQLVSRSGADVFTIFSFPETLSDDPVSWDHDLWRDSGRETGQLKHSLIVTTSIRPGKAIKLQAGLYRLVCSNGLTIEALSFGRVNMSHRSFSIDRVHDLIEGFTFQPESLRGAYLGKGSALIPVQDLLTRYWANGINLEEIPFFMKDHLTSLDRLPSWYTEPLMDFMDHMVDQEKIYAMDILNATTGALNYARQYSDRERAFERMFSSTDKAAQSIGNLIGMHSLI